MENQIFANYKITLRGVWFGMCLSTFVLIGIIFYILPFDLHGWSLEVSNDGLPLLKAYSIISCIVVFISFYVHKIPKISLFPMPTGSKLKFSFEQAKYLNNLVIKLALAESVTILGFTLTILERNPLLIILFSMVTLTVMFINYPFESKVPKN